MKRMLLLACLAGTVGLLAKELTPAGNPGLPWPATDNLGRPVPMAQEVGPPRTNRFVGMFYFLWQSTEVRQGSPDGEPYNVTKILAADPGALAKPGSPLWGPIGVYHYWAEPLLGYYANDDPWILRRHAQWLADAGVDTLIFDATNAQTYPGIYGALCETFRQVRRDGGRSPQIAFMVHTEAGRTADQLFRELYQPGRFRELWFHWQGRPLLLCDPAQASPAVRDFFTLRGAHWPFTLTNTPYAWHWEATFPQPYGYTDNPGQPEQVNVSVAQNLRQKDGKVTNMSDGNARGRSFHEGREDDSPGAVDRGLNFQEQWGRVFELDPPFAMVTGWNEWIAGRWGQPGGPIVFVDQYNHEFSRDIEPRRGGHGDNYYLQLIANIRRYKGAPSLPVPSGPKTIRLRGSFDQWRDVEPVFTDVMGDTAPRGHAGVLKLHFSNTTGRNDIVACQVARDRRSIYFHAHTQAPLTVPSDPNWMWLFIDADCDRATGWEGYDFMVNRTGATGDELWLERNTGGWNWRRLTRVKFRTEGADLHLAIPRSALGFTGRDAQVAFDFKWLDNAQSPGDLLDSYVNGDAAPDGRFNFRYAAE